MEKIRTVEECADDCRNELIQLLKEKGIDNPEVKEFFNSWIIKQEQKVDKASDRVLALIQYNLDLACLYFEAGYIAESLRAYKDTLTLVWNLNKDQLYDDIKKEMEVILKFSRKS